MSTVVSSPLLSSLLEAAPPESGIAWLDLARRENRQALAASGLPDTRVEAWKYTSLRSLARRSLAGGDCAAGSRPVDPASFALPGVEGPRLVFVNGVFRADLSDLSALPDEVVLQPLSRALKEDPEPLRFVLSRHYRDSGDAFARINAASATDGVVLRVGAGVRSTAPVHLVFIGAEASEALAWHARNVIELGEGSDLALVEQHLGVAAQSHLGTLVSDIELREHATLRHALLQSAGGTNLIRRNTLRLHAGARATMHVLELGGALVRHDLQVALVGDGARFDGRGVFMPQGRQHVDTQLAIRHEARDTVSDAHWRGVASDRGRGVFRGAVLVAPGADGSDANLTNKNLLLSRDAEIDTKPELEIYADEVQAVHGATVGQLDEHALFYLRSRGIGLVEARGLLTSAFCRAVLGDMANAALREHLAALLMVHLPA